MVVLNTAIPAWSQVLGVLSVGVVLLGCGVSQMPAKARRILVALLVAGVLSVGAVYAGSIDADIWVPCPESWWLYLLMYCWL